MSWDWAGADYGVVWGLAILGVIVLIALIGSFMEPPEDDE